MQFILKGQNDTINLNDPATGIYLNPELTGLTGLPEIRTSQGVNAGRDGGWTTNQHFSARFISVNGVIAHKSLDTVETLRQRLTALLAEKKLTMEFVSDTGRSYSAEVRVIGFTSPMKRTLNAAQFKLDLKADDPLLYDYSGSDIEATLNVQQELGGFEINFELPLFIGGGSAGTIVQNTGTTAVNPTFKAYGPLHSPTIVNQTTNQSIQVLVDLDEGDVLEINTKLQTVTLNGANVYYALADGFDFPVLNAGNNLMLLQSEVASDTGYADVSFNSGYIGI